MGYIYGAGAAALSAAVVLYCQYSSRERAAPEQRADKQRETATYLSS